MPVSSCTLCARQLQASHTTHWHFITRTSHCEQTWHATASNVLGACCTGATQGRGKNRFGKYSQLAQFLEPNATVEAADGQPDWLVMVVCDGRAPIRQSRD